MKVKALNLKEGDVLKTNPPMRIHCIEREGLTVVVRCGERVLRYLMSEVVGVDR